MKVKTKKRILLTPAILSEDLVEVWGDHGCHTKGHIHACGKAWKPGMDSLGLCDKAAACNVAGRTVPQGVPLGLVSYAASPPFPPPSPSIPLLLSPIPEVHAKGSAGGWMGSVRWLGTYRHLPAAWLTFLSRLQALKGLMHLPWSCCEMQRLKNSSTGSLRKGGRAGAFRSRQLREWPQPPALHVNEDKGLTEQRGSGRLRRRPEREVPPPTPP